MFSVKLCGFFLISAIISLQTLLVLSATQQQQAPGQQQQQQQDQCNDPQTQKECLKLKLENCIKNQVNQNDNVKNECQKGCSQFLGSNATAAIECVNNYEFEKLTQKLKIMECVEADVASGKTGLGMQLPVLNVNASDVIQMKVNQAVIKGFVPLKAYKDCMKNCIKRSSVSVTGGAKRQKDQLKLVKSTKINDCHVQVYGRPVTPVEDKTLKRVAKLCSTQNKMDKAAAANRLAQCLQSAFSGNTSASNQDNSGKCECPKAKNEKSEL